MPHNSCVDISVIKLFRCDCRIKITLLDNDIRKFSTMTGIFKTHAFLMFWFWNFIVWNRNIDTIQMYVLYCFFKKCWGKDYY